MSDNIERVSIVGSGKWFNLATAERYQQCERLQKAQQREALVRTQRGAWLWHTYTVFSNEATETYECLDDHDACCWLVDNGYFDVAERLTPAIFADSEL